MSFRGQNPARFPNAEDRVPYWILELTGLGCSDSDSVLYYLYAVLFVEVSESQHCAALQSKYFKYDNFYTAAIDPSALCIGSGSIGENAVWCRQVADYIVS